MKIGIDLRCISKQDLYSMFVLEVIKEIIKSKDYDLVIFTQEKLDFTLPNCEIIIVDEKPGSLKENITLKRKFEKQNLDLMIFFDEFNPITYKKNYILVLRDLKKLFFGPFKNSLDKHIYLKILTSNLKNAKKIICFDKQTLTDLNERLNIEEWKIEIISGFFPIKGFAKKGDITLLDIKKRHGIEGEYLIYDSNDSRNKNLERILINFKKAHETGNNLNLIILSIEACQNLEFRKIVIDNDLSKYVFFVGDIVDEKEKLEYYSQSAGVIFPSIYETFPFDLNYAIYYGLPILSSNVESIKKVMGDSISYYNSLSNTDTLKVLTNFHKDKKVNYDNIIEKFDEKKYFNDLVEVINKLKKGL